MSRGVWKRLGKTELMILKFLSTNPDKNITEIKDGVGYTHHSAVAKATYSLKDKGLVEELSKYRVKGREVSRWGLSFEGYLEAAINGCDVPQMIQKYQKYDINLVDMARLDDVLYKLERHSWSRDRGALLSKVLKAIPALVDIGMDREVVVASVVAGIIADWVNRNVKSAQKRMKFVKAFPNAKKQFQEIIKEADYLSF